MPSTLTDKRVVVVSVTMTEMLNVLGAKALELGIIDFTPTNIEVANSDGVGMAFDITFKIDTV
jgi:hypothetical protein